MGVQASSLGIRSCAVSSLGMLFLLFCFTEERKLAEGKEKQKLSKDILLKVHDSTKVSKETGYEYTGSMLHTLPIQNSPLTV